ncbi:MAG: hypothetical protein ACI9M6_000329, partial [Hydrogenophaga sp.]
MRCDPTISGRKPQESEAMTKFHTSQGGQTSIHDDKLEALRGAL